MCRGPLLLLLLLLPHLAARVSPTRRRSFFRYEFNSAGLLTQLNTTSQPAATAAARRVVWDEKGRYGPAFVQHYGHSSSSKGGAWVVHAADGSDHSCSNEQVATKLLPGGTAAADTVQVQSQCDALTVVDSYFFGASDRPVVHWNFTLTNRLSTSSQVRVPVNLGALQLGNSPPASGLDLRRTNLHRLRPEAGGRLELPWNETANYNNYPAAINVFSPLALLGENDEDNDAALTVAVLWLSDLTLPTNVTFKELPRSQFSPAMVQELGLVLAPGASRTFSLAISLAMGGSVESRWKAAVAPYKRVLEERHGTEPRYCPPGPFAYLVAENGATRPINFSTHRFHPGTTSET
jgi:hypothetical protein